MQLQWEQQQARKPCLVLTLASACVLGDAPHVRGHRQSELFLVDGCFCRGVSERTKADGSNVPGQDFELHGKLLCSEKRLPRLCQRMCGRALPVQNITLELRQRSGARPSACCARSGLQKCSWGNMGFGNWKKTSSVHERSE